MSRTTYAEFERPSGVLVTVEYKRSPYYGMVGPSWDDPGSPAEGGEVTIIKAHTEAEGWEAKWSDEEDQQWTDWLHANREPDELEDGDWE